jgi:putative ABC transport system substrate-binding protein
MSDVCLRGYSRDGLGHLAMFAAMSPLDPKRDMRSSRLGVTSGTIPDPKYDIIFLSDEILRAGEAMRRREFIVLVGCAAAARPIQGHAQQPGKKVYRVGLLTNGVVIGATDERRKNLVSSLGAQGFVEGQNLIFEERSADAQPRRLDALMGELKAANVDVIVTFGYPPALAAKNSAGSIPVVVTGAGDPVATGLVDGLARPGGNLTGVTELSTDLSTKRLEILKDAVPNLERVAMLWNADDLGMTLRYQAAESAARILGVKVQALGVREPDDFDHAFAEMQREPPQAILMVSDALTMLNRRHVVEFANINRLPTIFESGAVVREGGLMSYGPRQSEIGERAGDLVARILRGARPADLPLELPTRFEFLVNLKAARALGISLPSTLISRADEVIE